MYRLLHENIRLSCLYAFTNIRLNIFYFVQVVQIDFIKKCITYFQMTLIT